MTVLLMRTRDARPVTSAVDTNILLDVLIPNTAFGVPSQALLEQCSREGVLVLCEIVYAELAAHFGEMEQLTDFLGQTRIRLDCSETHPLAMAGKLIPTNCPSCRTPVGSRQHLVADFLFGAHATCRADRLLSRDQGFYRRYFSELSVPCGVSPG